MPARRLRFRDSMRQRCTKDPRLRTFRAEVESLQRSTDQHLREALDIDEFSLARMRKQFVAGYRGLTWDERLHLVDDGLNGRLTYLHREMATFLTNDQFAAWLIYIEHDERDIGEMEQGLYPISPRLAHQYCALLRIDQGFLYRGTDPSHHGQLHELVHSRR